MQEWKKRTPYSCGRNAGLCIKLGILQIWSQICKLWLKLGNWSGSWRMYALGSMCCWKNLPQVGSPSKPDLSREHRWKENLKDLVDFRNLWSWKWPQKSSTLMPSFYRRSRPMWMEVVVMWLHTDLEGKLEK